MSLKDRQRQFRAAIEADNDWTANTKLSENFGFSNSAKIVEGGLFTCNVNLDRHPDRNDQIVFTCLLTFPPQDEVFFAIFVKNEFNLFLQRLAHMPRLAAEEGEGSQNAERNNNVRFYLADDGRLYMRNKDFWDSMNFDRAAFNPAPIVDKIVFSIYPPSPSARRSLLAREFVGYLGSLVGQDKVHETNVWPDDATISPEMRRMPQSIPIEDIERSINALGGYYPGGEVRRFHAALNFLKKKHFVILSGLSGTGKTQLALKYARAVHGFTSNEATDPFLFPCPVRPEWTDPTGLTGYYDVLSNRYVVPTFLEAVLVATAHRTSPVFVILDEMNLARVEYYFSDILSCLESELPLRLHSHSVPIEGTTGTSIRAELPLPDNLYIIGTINVDETTNPISDKVLDRASVIDMSTVDIPGFLTTLTALNPDLTSSYADCEGILTRIHFLMSQQGLGFGYRVAEEFVRYHSFAAGEMGEEDRKSVV